MTDRFYDQSSGGPPLPDPSYGGEDNILSSSGMQYVNAEGQQVTIVNFVRALVTGDTAADHPIVNGTME